MGVSSYQLCSGIPVVQSKDNFPSRVTPAFWKALTFPISSVCSQWHSTGGEKAAAVKPGKFWYMGSLADSTGFLLLRVRRSERRSPADALVNDLELSYSGYLNADHRWAAWMFSVKCNTILRQVPWVAKWIPISLLVRQIISLLASSSLCSKSISNLFFFWIF